jgi:hypothetical protein
VAEKRTKIGKIFYSASPNPTLLWFYYDKSGDREPFGPASPQ